MCSYEVEYTFVFDKEQTNITINLVIMFNVLTINLAIN